MYRQWQVIGQKNTDSVKSQLQRWKQVIDRWSNINECNEVITVKNKINETDNHEEIDHEMYDSTHDII